MSSEQYVELLKNLLPRGKAWPKGVNTTFHKMLHAFAAEMERFDIRLSHDLVDEADPNTTLELLSDWERIAGIPDDPNTPLADTIELRRRDVLRKITLQGGQSRKFYIDLAAIMGFTITITEYREFKAGLARAGDRVSNGLWVFAWTVNASTHTVTWFRAGKNVAGEALAIWGNGAFERAISRSAPAHTLVDFNYT